MKLEEFSRWCRPPPCLLLLLLLLLAVFGPPPTGPLAGRTPSQLKLDLFDHLLDPHLQVLAFRQGAKMPPHGIPNSMVKGQGLAFSSRGSHRCSRKNEGGRFLTNTPLLGQPTKPLRRRPNNSSLSKAESGPPATE